MVAPAAERHGCGRHAGERPVELVASSQHQARARLLRHGFMLGIREQRPRARVLNDIGDLLGLQMVVDRREPDPGEYRSQRELDELHPITHQHRGVIVRPQTKPVAEQVGDPRGAIDQLGPGALAGQVIQRQARGVFARPLKKADRADAGRS
jgi:hypothetical protein